MRTVEIGIIGLGTVGGGVVRTIERHRESYRDAFGVDLHIKRACCRTPQRAEQLGLDPALFTCDWREITGDPDIDIVVELIGGIHPATELYLDAFAHGKHVVCANKALLGLHVEELAQRAHEAGVQIRCEAAAAGGIPIVNTLEHDLAGNSILTIAGIMNGTTNYILSRMSREGLDFDEALLEAQKAGYAEADPTADVDGLDAASKIAILASIGFCTRVTTDDVFVQGIRDITADDIAIARAMGYAIKLLAIGRATPAGLDVRVHPTMIPAHHQLAAVEGAMNAVYVVGDAVGETMFYGAGAGAFPTASAVVGDILALAKPLAQGAVLPAEPKPFSRTLALRPIEQLETRYYVRLVAQDRPCALADATRIFAENGISIEQVKQIPAHGDGAHQMVFVTRTARECDMRRTAKALGHSTQALAVGNMIRIEDTASWVGGDRLS